MGVRFANTALLLAGIMSLVPCCCVGTLFVAAKSADSGGCCACATSSAKPSKFGVIQAPHGGCACSALAASRELPPVVSVSAIGDAVLTFDHSFAAMLNGYDVPLLANAPDRGHAPPGSIALSRIPLRI